MNTTPPVTVLPPDSLLDSYKILQLKTQGKWGAHYWAQDKQKNTPVILAELTGNEAELKQREKSLKALLSSPKQSINTPLHVFEHDARLFYTLPQHETISLRQLVEGGDVDAEQLIDILKAILADVEVAHAAGLYFKGLNPDSIHLTADQQPLLSDALLMDYSASPYSAAEQAHADADPRTDLYALAASFYEMITDSTPDGNTPLASTPAADGLPAPLIASIDKNLSPALDNRHASAADWAQTLNLAPQGEKSSLPIYGAASLIAVMIGGALLFLTPAEPAPPQEQSPAATASAFDTNTLEGRVYTYLQTEAMLLISQEIENRAQDIYVKCSRDLIQHNASIDKKIESANRAAISNMIREVEDSYPKLSKAVTEEFEAQEASLQKLEVFQKLSDNLIADYPCQNEEERAQLAQIHEQWLAEYEEMLYLDVLTNYKERLSNDIADAMKARLKICHHYVGRYMGG